MMLTEVDLARLCDAVYDEEFDHEVYRAFDAVYPIISRDAEAVCLMLDGTMFVCIRGTEIKSVRDLMTVSRSVFKRKYFEGKVHAGFLSYAEAILTDVSLLVAFHKPEQIVLCGHSLGGAVALLLSLQMKRFTDNLKVFTIGCPKVGDRKFVDYLYEQVGEGLNVYALKSDLIPMLPPSFWPFGYRRVPGEVILNTDRLYSLSILEVLSKFFGGLFSGSGMSLKFTAGVLLRKLGFGMLADHSRETYRKELEKKV